MGLRPRRTAGYSSRSSDKSSDGARSALSDMADGSPSCASSSSSSPSLTGAISNMAIENHATKATVFGILDMPDAWTKMLVTALSPVPDPDSPPWDIPRADIASLMMSCRAMRTTVLSHCEVVVRCDTAYWDDEEEMRRCGTRLQSACKYAPRVSLVMQGGDAEYQAGVCTRFMERVARAARRAGHGLEAIQRATLENMEVDSLVPSWLPSTCPGVTSLTLERVYINALNNPLASLTPCRQIKELHLRQLPEYDESAMSRWTDLLHALPSLETVTVSFQPIPDTHYRWKQRCTDRQFLECCTKVPALQQLRFLSANIPQEVPLTCACFMRMRELQLPDLLIKDSAMAQLLGLTTLRQLGCHSFKLTSSYTHRRCSWTHLGFEVLDMTSFDRLPLDRVQCFRFNEQVQRITPPRIIPSPDLLVNKRVASLLGRQGGLQATDAWEVYVDNTQSEADSTCLAATMAVLSTFAGSRVKIFRAKPITPRLLTAMHHHLPPTLSHLELVSSTFHPDAWPHVLPNLAVPNLTLGLVHEPTEAQLSALCVAATQQISVTLSRSSEWEEGWEDRMLVAMPLVAAAMAAAGHAHVAVYFVMA